MAKQAEPTADDLKLLIKDETAVDIAMFGRMLAAHTDFNVEAAVQVAMRLLLIKL
jgi:CRISPR system Cascade subunit CasC